VIRFACPGCRRVLSGRNEQAGKIVTCPKCGQRMQAPRPAMESARTNRAPARRLLRAGIALIGMLLLAGVGGGIWLWMHSLSREPEPSAAVLESPRSSSDESVETPAVVEDKIGAATVREQPTKPTPVARALGSSMQEPPPLPPVVKALDAPVEERKKIELADDLPPELAFDLVDAINFKRTKEGVDPIFLDVDMSRVCQSRAERLARHTERLDDKANSSEASVAAEAPLSVVEKWLKDPKQRAAILEPRLRTFGAGYARNAAGESFSVFDWTRGLDRDLPSETTPVTGALVYPVPGQTRVSLWFPGNETPDPLPQTKDKLAGYPITLIFPQQTRVEDVVAHLSDKEERDIPIWLSSPENPANPQVPGSQHSTICLIAKKPLRPNTRYHVVVSATVNGAAWSAKWSFTTISEGEIHHEMAGTFLRTLNRLRRSAGLPPVPLVAERSKACAAHVRYLSQNVPNHPVLNWNDEKPDLPGYTAEGAAVARTASIQGGGWATEAVSGLIDSIISRPRLLDPRLRKVGLGYTPFALGGWLWVIDLYSEPGHDADKECFYPAPDQENVPLNYRPNEVPNPIPAPSPPTPLPSGERGWGEGGRKLAGYAITALFGPRARVTVATAKLVDEKGAAVDGWLSSPEAPAIAGYPQHFLCFLPKSPLRPNTRYTTTFEAEVNGRPWRRTWNFTTLQEPDCYADKLDEKIVALVNAVRKAAGLPLVRLDTELSRACQSHARYLALNHHRPAAQGMGVHRQDADLPGASPEGARAAKESVVAVILNPQMCVEYWMATLYHRIPLLRPDLERIGFGHAPIQGHNKWACVLDTGNGRASQGREQNRAEQPSR
jgi:uncharacterized protein YkwD